MDKKHMFEDMEIIDHSKSGGLNKGFRETLMIHQEILSGLKTQKARNDEVLEKGLGQVEEEIDIPSNHFMKWVYIIRPFFDIVKSSKVMDYEIIKRYQAFVKDLVAHNKEFVNIIEEIEKMRYDMDFIIDVVFRLEKKLIQSKKINYDKISKKQARIIKMYKLLPEKFKEDSEAYCVYCGAKIKGERLGVNLDCYDCSIIPENYKPFSLEEEIIEEPVEETHIEEESDIIDEEVIKEPEEIDELEQEKIEEMNSVFGDKNEALKNLIMKVEKDYLEEKPTINDSKIE